MSVGSTNGDAPILRLRPDAEPGVGDGDATSSPTTDRDLLFTPEQLQVVVDMGFPEAVAKEVLKVRGGDVAAALDDLIAANPQPEVMEVEDPQEALERERKEMAEAMRQSLEEAQTRQEVEEAEAQLREQENTLMTLFPNSSVLDAALKAELPEEVLGSDEMRMPMIELLRLEANCYKWFGGVKTVADIVTHHFTGVGRGIAAVGGETVAAGPSGAEDGGGGGGGAVGRKRKAEAAPPGRLDRGKGKAVAPPAEDGAGGSGRQSGEYAAHVVAVNKELEDKVLGFRASDGEWHVPPVFRPAPGEEAAARRASAAGAGGSGAGGASGSGGVGAGDVVQLLDDD